MFSHRTGQRAQWPRIARTGGRKPLALLTASRSRAQKAKGTKGQFLPNALARGAHCRPTNRRVRAYTGRAANPARARETER